MAFENICLNHIPQIKKALGIAGIYTEESIWRYHPKNNTEKGAQIDLLLDRNDQSINIVEIKFWQDGYALTQKSSEALVEKKRIFIQQTQTKKSVFITLLTTYGVAENAYYLNTVQNQLTMDVLFVEV